MKQKFTMLRQKKDEEIHFAILKFEHLEKVRQRFLEGKKERTFRVGKQSVTAP